jgi:hypothetical protein
MTWLSGGVNNQSDVSMETLEYRKNRFLVAYVFGMVSIPWERPLQFGALPGR